MHEKWQKMTPEQREKYLSVKRKYHNEKLTEFVENKNDMTRIIEYKGHLYQKIDPIYMDPEHKFLKAHFYAPRKMIFGNYYHTFWINILVMWFSSIMLYLILYFRLLHKFLDLTGHFFGVIKAKIEKK